MSRSVAWRRVVGDAASWRQDQALNATMYILREIGPTGFLLKEEGENKKFKVYLGDPHKCNCSVFVKEKDVCKHICWLLLKKFRVPRHNPVSWQLGLVEREINEVLRGHLVNDAPRRAPAPGTGPHRAVATAADGRAVLQQKEISEDDVCPICQEELLEKKLPVTFCKFGCGNSIHIKCMKVWAEHQKTQGEKVIKCPLCREDFGPFELLRQEGRNADQGARNSSQLDRHIWVTCRSCHTNPVIGKCYRCTSCVDFHLCQSCFNTPVHTEHSFQFRQKRNQRWRPAQRTLGSLPPGIISDLLSRDLSHGDYDLLLQLDSQPEPGTHSVPDEVLESFPLIRVRENSALLAPGVQCRMCLRGYDLGQHVRKLPCTHKFHRDCIDPWLLHSHVTCPVDGQTVWSPHQEQRRPQRGPTQVSHGSGSAGPRSHSGSLPGDLILEVPGLGLRVNSDTASTSWLPGGGIPGDSPAERVRPTIPNYRDGEIPTGLGGALFGLNGTSLIRNNSSPLSNIEDSSLGTRLLVKARLRRQKISQHLNSLHTDRIHLEPVAPSIPILRELDNTDPGITIGWSPGTGETTVALGRPPHSAPEDQPNSANRGRSRYRTNRANSMPSVERGRQASLTRTRSNSGDRITQPLGTGLESMFLGSNPTESPPSRGLVRPPLHRPPPKPRRNRVPQDNSRTPNLGLEGYKIS